MRNVDMFAEMRKAFPDDKPVTAEWLDTKPKTADVRPSSALRFRRCLPLTTLGFGALFFLVDTDAEIGVTMCSRPMTEDEHAEYAAMPAANRRRKPGSTIEDDEERARRKRTQALMAEIAGQRVQQGRQHGMTFEGMRAKLQNFSGSANFEPSDPVELASE